MENQPGPYIVVFSPTGQPSIRTSMAIPLDNPNFVARQGSESEFIFSIEEGSEVEFATPPTLWGAASSAEPPSGSGIAVTSVNSREVKITVTPPNPLPQEPDFSFGLRFSNNASIPDPTIVEKPPDGPVWG